MYIVGQGIFPYQCDMGNPKEIENMFEWIETNKDLGRIDICINNAACVWAKGLMEMNLEEMQAMLNVNVLGYNYATKLSIQSMMKHNVDDALDFGDGDGGDNEMLTNLAEKYDGGK